jgi:hypothetical protein
VRKGSGAARETMVIKWSRESRDNNRGGKEGRKIGVETVERRN